MRLNVIILVSFCWWGSVAQDAEQDQLGHSEQTHYSYYQNDNNYRNPTSFSQQSAGENYEYGNYERQGSQTDLNNLKYTITNSKKPKQSIGSVTVQLHLNDNKPPETDSVEYDPSKEEFESKKKSYLQSLEQRNSGKYVHAKEHSKSLDSDTGANNYPSAQYALPPQGYVNNYRQSNIRFIDNESQFAPTPSPASAPSGPSDFSGPSGPFNVSGPTGFSSESSDSDKSQQSLSASNTNYVVTPAPPHFVSSMSPQYFQSNYQFGGISQLNDVSTPAPNNHFGSNSPISNQFGSQFQGFGNSLQYLSTAFPRIQQFSTPSPSMQFLAQIAKEQPAASQNQYVSTPAPNTLYTSTPSPHNYYVSTPVHYATSQPSAQYATSAPYYENRLNQQNRENPNTGEKQMHIDHFDNALSGVRNPKSLQPPSIFVSSTPATFILTTTIPKTQNKNENNWRAGLTSIDLLTGKNQNQNHLMNQMNDNQNYHPNNQQQSSNQNGLHSSQSVNTDMEYVNNLMNRVMAQNNNYHNDKIYTNKNVQRDLDKETNTPNLISNGDFGWRLSPKKQSSQNTVSDNIISNSYSFSSPPSNFGSQESPEKSNTVFEYQPYPDNPFLNHISFATTSPPANVGSIQSISFQPDNNHQQNVNVGYSIGFGLPTGSSQGLQKNEQPVYTTRYSLNNYQDFSTSHPISDIVKGVQVSKVNVPEQSNILKDYNNDQYERLKKSLFSTDSKKGTNENSVTASKFFQTYKDSDSANINKLAYSIPLKSNDNYNSPLRIVSTYFGNTDERNNANKWINEGVNVEQASSPSNFLLNKPLNYESSTPSPLIHISNPNFSNDVVTNIPYFFSTQKNTDGIFLQSFDHENALKNLQHIGLSNAVPSSASPLVQNSGFVTLPPLFVSSPSPAHALSTQINSLSSGHHLNYPQAQAQISHNSYNTLKTIDQGLSNMYKNFKPVEHTYYKENPSIVNIQPFKSNGQESSSSGVNELRSYVFGNPSEQRHYESQFNIQNIRPSDAMQSVHFIVSTPPDMVAHASNTEPKQASHSMEYVPAETFRQNSRDKKSQEKHKNDQISLDYNQVQSNSQVKYPRETNFPTVKDHRSSFNKLENGLYNEKINQDMGSHTLEPLFSSGNKNVQYLNSNNYQSQKDNLKQINPQDSKIMTIHGVQVANPYNVDMKLVSEMLQGKAVVDESRLESVRDKLSRIVPIQLDTSDALREMAVQHPHLSFQFDIPNQDRYEQFFSRAQSRQNNNEKNNRNSFEELTFLDVSKPMKENYDDQHERLEHSIPNLASEQLQNSVQTVLTHQIGAVIEQPTDFSSRQRSNDDAEVPVFNDFMEVHSDYEKNGEKTLEAVEDQQSTVDDHYPNKLSSEKGPKIRAKPDVDEPYPLLKPPLPPRGLRAVSHKKSDRQHLHKHHRPTGSRHNRHFKSRNETKDFGINRNIRTGLSPPSVILSKISG